jgi:hypothetical protein
MGCVTVFTKATQTESNYFGHVLRIQTSGVFAFRASVVAVANPPVTVTSSRHPVETVEEMLVPTGICK